MKDDNSDNPRPPALEHNQECWDEGYAAGREAGLIEGAGRFAEMRPLLNDDTEAGDITKGVTKIVEKPVNERGLSSLSIKAGRLDKSGVVQHGEKRNEQLTEKGEVTT